MRSAPRARLPIRLRGVGATVLAAALGVVACGDGTGPEGGRAELVFVGDSVRCNVAGCALAGVPNIYAVRRDGSGLIKLTDFGPGPPPNIALSPDGRRVVFTQASDLYIVDVSDGDVDLLLSRAALDINPVWSPDGSRVAFESLEGPRNLWVISNSGSGLVDLGPGGDASWAPDGFRIVFVDVGTIGGATQDVIVTVNADGTGRALLTNGANPQWSPDGTRIAFTRSEPPSGDFGFGRTTIHTIHPDGSALTVLHEMDGASTLVWSPDGTRLAWSEARTDSTSVPGVDLLFWKLFVIHADGTGLIEITGSEPLAHLREAFLEGADPVWSPDGSELAFALRRLSPDLIDDVGRIFLARSDGTNLRALTTGDRAEWDPDWR